MNQGVSQVDAAGAAARKWLSEVIAMREKPLETVCRLCGGRERVPYEREADYMPASQAREMLGGISPQRIEQLVKRGVFYPEARRGRNRWLLRWQVEARAAEMD